MGRLAERQRCGCCVAVAYLGGDVVGCVGTYHRRTCRNGITQAHHHRQVFVLHHYRLGGVTRLLQRVCQHHGDGFTDKPGAVDCQRVAQRAGAGRAVRAFEVGVAGHWLHAGRHQVGAANHRSHTRRGQCCGFVDRDNACVRIR